MTKNVTIEVFVWGNRTKTDYFCKRCGKSVGTYAAHHSQLCQACNLRKRMEKLREAERRVSA